MATVRLAVPYSDKERVLEVDEESADHWRSLGYRDVAPAKKAPAKKTPAKKTAKK